jgi:hypothetical protein
MRLCIVVVDQGVLLFAYAGSSTWEANMVEQGGGARGSVVG